MVQYYTLDQAAQLLRVTPDQLREMVNSRKVRAFQDRGTLRFRTQDIDEMARSQGMGSDAELQMGKGAPPTPGPSSSAKRRSKLSPSSEADDTSAEFDLNLSPEDEPSSPPSGKGAAASSRKNGNSPSPAKKGTLSKTSDSDVRLVKDKELDFPISTEKDPPAAQSPAPKRKSIVTGAKKGDSDVRLENPTPASDSDVKIVPDSGDDIVALDPDRPKTASDSDIRLETDDRGGKKHRPGSDPMITEEIVMDLDLDAMKTKPAQSKLGKTGKGAPPLKLPTSSPFELSEADIEMKSDAPPGKGKKKEQDSSDFELTPVGNSDLDIDLDSGDKPLLADNEIELGEVSGAAGASGINLQDPVDSGISLEADGSDEMEFELSLDDSDESHSTADVEGNPSSSSEFELSLEDSSVGHSTPPSDSEFELTLDEESSDIVLEDSESTSDSEFELTLDEEGGLTPVEDSDSLEQEDKDLFEDTDFNVPSLDDESGSEAVALDDDGSSDFELDLGDSGVPEEQSESEVVALDDEAAPEDESAETVARPLKKRKTTVAPEDSGLDLDLDTSEDEDEVYDEEGEEELDADGTPGRVRTVEAAPAPWGVVPVIMLFPCVIILFVVGLMGFELLQGTFGYHKDSRVSTMIIHPIARMFDDSLPKE
jgi:excisionase family DNA binding protein